MATYYHATDYKNMHSILNYGIWEGSDGMVYLTDSPESAATFVAIRGVKNIIVFAVDIDESKVVESFDHSCRAWMHRGNIPTEYLSRVIQYDMCTVLCEDHFCVHNRGSGVYGVCDIPCPTYCGIDRVYRSTCKNRQVEDTLIPVSTDKDCLSED